MGAGGDLNIVGSAVFADGAVGLHADADLNLLATSEAHLAYESRYTKKSGIFSSGGLSITIGSKSKTEIAQSQETRQASSSISSLAGDILATAGNQYLQLSSDLVAPQGDIHVSARNIAIQSNNNTRSVLNIVRERQSGVTLSASHPLISAALTVKEMEKVRKRTENGRYQALALLTSGLTVYNQFGDFGKLLDAKPQEALQGFTFSASLGTNSSDYESLSGTSTPAESALNAGRDISLTATGGGNTALADSGDISVVGGRLSASRNLSLTAARDITLAAAVGTNTERTKSTTSSASIGLSYTMGGQQSGLHLNIAASRSNAWSNGWGTTYFNSEAIAGQQLNLSSGRHTTLNGAKASGNRLVARVGTAGSGSLTLSSPIDEQHYKAREESFGFSASIPIPGMGAGGSFSINASKLSLLGEFESVRQQSSLVAGTGGFDIQVNGHTHLKGAAISSEAAAGLNRFSTQTLTHEDIVNRDRVSGKSSSIGISTTGTDVKGSSVGFARVDTNRTSDTQSSIAPGSLTITRPDLQANAVNQIKAGQREPLETQRNALQVQLDQLLWNEPPRCSGCQIQSTPTDPVGAPPPNTNIGQAELPDTGPPGEQAQWGNTNPDWTAWDEAVRSLQGQISSLQTRINAINVQSLKGLDSLSRSPSPLHQPLLHTFDAGRATRELKDGTAVTAAFGKAAYKAAGDLATTREGEAKKLCNDGSTAACEDAKRWGEGGRYRVALHGLIGALSHGQAGAIANVTASAATPELVKLAEAAGFAKGTLAHQLLVTAAATAVGAGAGGTAGAAAAFNADANNRQMHLNETRWIKSNARLLAQHLSAIVGRPVTEGEAIYWAGLAGGALIDQAAYTSVQFIRGANISEEARLYDAAKQYVTVNATGSFVDQYGKTQRLFVAAPGDRFNTFMYADLRNNAEYREHMWELAGQNLRSDAPTAAELTLYNERQALLLQQTVKELALFAATGGASVGAVRLLNRLSPPRSAPGPVAQTVDLDALDALVREHSRAGSGGHTGLDLTQAAALRAIGETQPQGTKVVVAGAGIEGPDVKFISLTDGRVVDTVQVKTATTPRNFEANIKLELGKELGNAGGSRVVVVVYPNEADVAQLMGKLQNMTPEKTVGRSILVVSPSGKIIIPLQPFPRKPT
ncbi:MAG: hemagglutinin repeat-containing protein [Inhella sp.]